MALPPFALLVCCAELMETTAGIQTFATLYMDLK